MVVKMLELAVKECLKNHVYRFNGKYFVQRTGGAIGLRLTGVVAEISMAAWEKRFRELAMENNIKLFMSKIFVDDQNLIFRLLRLGTRWTGREMKWTSEWEEENRIKDEPADARCMWKLK